MNAYTNQILDNFSNRADQVFSEVSVDGEFHTLRWSDLEVGCRQVVGSLNQACGAEPSADGGVVLIFLPHGLMLFPAFLGTMLGGFTPSFMPCPSPRQDSILYWKSHQALLEKIRPTAIITCDSMVEQMREADLDLHGATIVLEQNIQDYVVDQNAASEFVSQSGDAVALLQHSSGTTGLKKGVALSFDAIHQHAVAYGKSLELNDDDVIVSWLPLYHDMGLIACFITPSFHATKTIHFSAFDWLNRPNILFNAIKQYKGTLCWLPNFAFEHLTNTLARHAGKFDLSSMRAFISCSEPVKSSTFDRFASKFAESNVRPDMLKVCYAMAEVVFGVTQVPMSEANTTLQLDSRSLNVGDSIELCSDSDHTVSYVSCGSVIDQVSVVIVDENRSPVADGVIGEISISSEFLFSGYNKDPERTARNLTNETYYSNDLGFVWQENLYVLGRLDDLIIVNGRNLFAHEIEAIASQLDGVKAGRVVALPYTDEKIGSDVLILMAERDITASVEEEQVVNAAITQIQSELDVVPRAVMLVEPGTLIKTSSGKMSRKENHRIYLSHLEETNKKRAA